MLSGNDFFALGDLYDLYEAKLVLKGLPNHPHQTSFKEDLLKRVEHLHLREEKRRYMYTLLVTSLSPKC